jgi:hypothetical protein
MYITWMRNTGGHFAWFPLHTIADSPFAGLPFVGTSFCQFAFFVALLQLTHWYKQEPY